MVFEGGSKTTHVMRGRGTGTVYVFFILCLWLCLTTYVWISHRITFNIDEAQGHNQPIQQLHKHIPPAAGRFPAQLTDLREDETRDVREAQILTEDPENVELESMGVTLQLALQQKWVGFPEIAGSDCQQALYSQAKNNQFPQTVKRIRPSQYTSDSKDCKVFRRKYGFNRYPPVSEEEKAFPIAYIILFHKDLDQVVFLLRALYHPHNVFCLSVDTKASIEFLEAVKGVARCLSNVFLASKMENIVYAGFTRLMADINCMQDLLRHSVQWKYVINMPGQQFPLRINLEMVRILKHYNGANDIEGLTGDMLVSERYAFKHTYVTDTRTGGLRVKRLLIHNDPPPHGLTMLKGSTYGTFSRAFVEFVIHNPIAKDFLEWCKTIKSPDEYFWATLHHAKQFDVPGGFKGEPHRKPWLTSFSLWETNPRAKCATVYVHKICIFSPEDFPTFIHRGQLFANKFYITHHPAALHCLDEMLVNLTFTKNTRDLSFYKNLPFALKSTEL